MDRDANGLDGFLSSSISKKLGEDEASLCKIFGVEGDEDPHEVLIIGDKVDSSNKGKTKICYDETWKKIKNTFILQNTFASGPGNSTCVAGSVDCVDPLKSSTTGSSKTNNLNSSNSDLSHHDGDEEVDGVSDFADYASECDYNDEFLYDDDYLSMQMQAQFDNVDLPAGKEVSLHWLKDPALSEKTPSANACTTSSSTVPAESCSNGKLEVNGDVVMQNFHCFKNFDSVEDFSDHHYGHISFSGEQAPKNWAKSIQEEWNILEKSLPDTIFVRVYEARMDLLRAVIVGPSGTPYHDGLFVFDCLFPTNYPNSPPMVYYYSGGLRINPNLYDCGKVCLSLLGTWTGKQTEMWIPGRSTMLQVLISIQALILNSKPFFNEPGYETSYVGQEGERRSKKYNENVFILSLKTMMYTLRRPPKYFEDFVAGHFRNRAYDILLACKAYLEGAQIGSVIDGGVQEGNKGDKNGSYEFYAKLCKMMNVLVTNFSKNGSAECEQFRVPE